MTYDQLRSLIYLNTKTNVTSMPNATLNLYTQPAEDEVVSLVITADGRWQYDDKNYSDLAIATTTITANQQDYSLTTDHLQIERIEVKSSNSYRQLVPYDNADYNGLSITQLALTTGFPIMYDLIGNSIFLWPVPNFTLASALKIYFRRGPLKYDYSANANAGQFTDSTGSGATTDKPGFVSLFHDLISDQASFKYCIANGLASANGFLLAAEKKKAALTAFYGKRDKDDPPQLTMAPIRPFK